MRGPTLRLVCVNDVYSLENLPRLRTLVRRCASEEPADMLVTTLAGDFVAPSLLSSLDRGAGMIDCLNAIPITHVCFGNHELDVPAEALADRVREFRGTWLNTNVPGYVPSLPASQVLTVRGEGTRPVKVGLVGVLTEDPSLYRPGVFGGLPMLPANATVLAAARVLVEEGGCACVLALTHQALVRDRALALSQGDPPVALIVGGHEHEPYIEQLGSAWLVKAGTDAVYAAVVDLAWGPVAPSSGPDLPVVTVRLVPLRELPEDEALRELVDQRMAPVRALHVATLLRLRPGEALSSVGTRVQQTSVGSMIATWVRDDLGADACLINGGGIRGAREYRGAFTFGDLETELPFPNEVVVATMPGRVLREAVQGSRSNAPRPAPGYLQVDEGLVVDADGRITSVRAEAFDEAREYRVATVRVLFDGMDNVAALLRFAQEHPERIPPRDSGRELKMIVVEALSLALWRELGGFDRCDINGDARVSVDELRQAIERASGESAPALLVEGILRALDADHDGSISEDESRARAVAWNRSPG
ncbi:MAG: 5'-nucleotidase C-terminal domain-containing protein [Deltaproteobacteria bacterium]|jgi:2',3'-cyclic-nucleotide 2'-phosphodiesterase (5'-nucleotidase family)|nr:5'-nucleotidase C-terminal domain-containing protein [Deltaproteobacteria bacterium]